MVISFGIAMLLIFNVPEVAAAARSATLANCQSCLQMALPREEWECTTQCKVAPTGVQTYGKLGISEILPP